MSDTSSPPPEVLAWLWNPIVLLLTTVIGWFSALVVWLFGRSYRAEVTDRFAANEATLVVHSGQIKELDTRMDNTEKRDAVTAEKLNNIEKQNDRIEKQNDRILDLLQRRTEK